MNWELDIKVLRAIHLLCTSGSVTKTAEMLQVTPGAVSYLINKARKSTGTALFFRTRSGMKPDTLALELSQRYLTVTKQFIGDDSASFANLRTFVITTYAIFELLLSLSLQKTSNLSFSTTKHDVEKRLMRLRNKEVDMDIGSRLPVDRSIIQLRLFTSDVGALVSQNHTSIRDTFTLRDWHDNRHIIWTRGMQFISDDVKLTHNFDELYEQQEIAIKSSNSLNITALCAYSDLVCLMPVLIGRKLTPFFPVKTLALPVEMQMSYECYVHYHRGLAGNPSFRELLEKIQKVVHP